MWVVGRLGLGNLAAEFDKGSAARAARYAKVAAENASGGKALEIVAQVASITALFANS